MEKFEYNGEVYYTDKGLFYDSGFIELPIADRKFVAEAYFEEKAKFVKSSDDYVELIRNMKIAGCYQLSIHYCLEFLDIAEIDMNYNRDVNIILAILSSNYRLINEPLKAIELTEKFKSDYWNVSFLTSIAAAYCDVGDFNKAKKYANMAYAKQGGGVKYKNELSLVYKRIQKETGESPF